MEDVEAKILSPRIEITRNLAVVTTSLIRATPEITLATTSLTTKTITTNPQRLNFASDYAASSGAYLFRHASN
jgi:hypothetical protein